MKTEALVSRHDAGMIEHVGSRNAMEGAEVFLLRTLAIVRHETQKIADVEKRLKEEEDKVAAVKGELGVAQGEARRLGSEVTVLQGRVAQRTKERDAALKEKGEISDVLKGMTLRCEELVKAARAREQELQAELTEAKKGIECEAAAAESMRKERDGLAAEKERLMEGAGKLAEVGLVQGFEHALEQIAVVAPEVDCSKLGLSMVVQDGKLVEDLESEDDVTEDEDEVATLKGADVVVGNADDKAAEEAVES